MSAKKEFIPQLTGIRIFLSFAVILSNMMLYHSIDPGFIQNMNWPALKLISVTPIRVDIFFMLTGFLLFYVYAPYFCEKVTAKEYGRFILIRLGRIYPVHFATMALILILFFVGIWQKFDFHSATRVAETGNWLLNLTLTNAWGFNQKLASWNGPAWSVSAEFFNYLIFPILALMVSSIKTLRVKIISLLFCLGLYGYIQEVSIKNLYVDYGSGGLLRAATGMVVGIFLAQVYLTKRLNHLPWDYITVLIFAFMVGALIYNASNDITFKYLFYIPLPLFVFAIASSKGFIKKIFSIKPLLYLGNISFCVYMLHQPIIRILGFFFHDYYLQITGFEAVINLILILTIITSTSALFYHIIETPVRKAINKKYKLHKKNAP